MVSAVVSTMNDDSQRNELAEIYNKHINKFYAIAFSKLKNNQDAEDAIQEAFLDIAKNPEILFSIPVNKRAAYMNVIVLHKATNIFKKRNKIAERELDYDTCDDLLSNDSLLDEKVIGDFNCGQILKFIRNMPESLLEAVYLKYNFNMNIADIAKSLGVSEDVVRKRLSRAYFKINEYRERMRNE